MGACGRQQQTEQVYHGLKGASWADRRANAAVNRFLDQGERVLLHVGSVAVARCAVQVGARSWPGTSIEQMRGDPVGIQQIGLLHVRQVDKSPGRTVTMATKRIVAQSTPTGTQCFTELFTQQAPKRPSQIHPRASNCRRRPAPATCTDGVRTWHCRETASWLHLPGRPI